MYKMKAPLVFFFPGGGGTSKHCSPAAGIVTSIMLEHLSHQNFPKKDFPGFVFRT